MSTLEGPRFSRLTNAAAGGGLLALVWLSPLPFGSVQPWARNTLLVLSGLTLAANLVRKPHRRRQRIPPGMMPLFGFLFLGLAAGGLQLLPLPPQLVQLIDPGAARWWGAAGTEGFWTISLAPNLTRRELALALTALAAFISTLIYVPNRRSRQSYLSILATGFISSAFALSLAGIILRSSAPGTIWGLPSTHHGNPFGPFVNRNHFAGYAGMAVPLGLALLLARPRRGQSSAFLHRLRQAGRTDLRPSLLAFMTLVIAAAVLLSGSRGGILSLAGGMLVLAFLCRRVGLLSRTNLLRLSGGAVLAAVVFGTWFGWEGLVGRFADGPRVPIRLLLWRDAGRILQDFPVFGTGLGTFSQIFPSYRSFPSAYTYTHAENDYLQLLVELGMWGLISAGGAAFIAAKKIVKISNRVAVDRPLRFIPHFRCGRAALFLGATAGASTLLIHGMFNFNFHIPSNLVIFSALSAIALSTSDDSRPSAPPPGWGPFLLAEGNRLLRCLNNLLYRNPPRKPRAILVWRTGNLGDSWCALPALSALARRFPETEIAIATAAAAAGNPHSARVFAEIGGFTKFITYRPKDLRRGRGIRQLRARIRKGKFDLVVYLGQSSAPLGRVIRDLIFLRLAGIKSGVGFRWNKAILGGRALPLAQPLPDEASRLVGLLSSLGIAREEIRWNPPARPEALLRREQGRLIALHPTAKFPAKRWGSERMVETARILAEEYPDLKFVVVGDPSAEPFARALRVALGKELVIDLAGKTSFSELAAVLGEVDLLISPDSGPVHVAAAAGTPVVGIYSSRDLPGAWHPHGPGHIVLRTDPPCTGCLRTFCPHPVCLDDIAPIQAAAAAGEILERSKNTR